LLKDHEERRLAGYITTEFKLSHKTDLDEQLKGAMVARNERIIQIGQENYAHFCDTCLIVKVDGNVQSETFTFRSNIVLY